MHFITISDTFWTLIKVSFDGGKKAENSLPHCFMLHFSSKIRGYLVLGRKKGRKIVGLVSVAGAISTGSVLNSHVHTRQINIPDDLPPFGGKDTKK